MASMLLRAFRHAARSAASAASRSRCAAVEAASSRLASGGAPNRLLGIGLPITSPPSMVRGLSSQPHEDVAESAYHLDPDLFDPEASEVDFVEFVADDKDLASDEALWALYERWCNFFGEERDRDEMNRRFDHFKKNAFLVDRFNKEAIRDGRSHRLELNMFADGKLREQVACKASSRLASGGAPNCLLGIGFPITSPPSMVRGLSSQPHEDVAETASPSTPNSSTLNQYVCVGKITIGAYSQ
ncbi:hypothetical protein E2562_037431 [Oryza meyeriana var. granulata]|uniref:Cathepsin propeptide inhibitor domain-containing protein n=1 Tax=Oryza meyeriana var. granulata TaxID=110450 RepID=A0A6G1CLK9_9ORYZ|nr:hypothetical protein E2562_037431 [Oryza meyeriana var. granulata]